MLFSKVQKPKKVSTMFLVFTLIATAKKYLLGLIPSLPYKG